MNHIINLSAAVLLAFALLGALLTVAGVTLAIHDAIEAIPNYGG